MNIAHKKENVIGFYTWYQVFDEFSKSQQDEIISYIKKISRNIEHNVNNDGGIAGKRVKIYNHIVYPKNTNKESYINFLKQNKDIFFIGSFPNYSKVTRDDINFNDYIQLDEHATFLDRNDLPWNVFSTEERDTGDIWDFIKSHFSDKNIIFLINDGYRNKKNIKNEKYKNILRERINKPTKYNIEYKVIPDFHDNQTELISFIKGLNKNDVIFLSMPSVMPLDMEEEGMSFWVDLKSKILKTFITTQSKSSLFTSHLDPREVYDCFNYEDSLPNKKLFSRAHNSEGKFNYLRMQDLHFEVDPDIKPHISTYLSMYHSWQFEDIKLIKYLFDKEDYVFTSREDFLKETSRRLKNINGVDDIYIGDSKTISFNEKQFNTINDSYLFQHKKVSNDTKFIENILYKNQFKYDPVKKNYHDAIKTNYINIDILKFHNISIEESIFTAKFYLELTTTNSEGIEILSFNNSTLNTKSSIIKIDQNKIDHEYFYFRYLIEDTFSFDALPDNYPFDKQLIFIDLSIINEKKYGILQSPHALNVDKKFQIDGWNLKQTRSGPFREKIKYVSPVNDMKKVSQKISIRIGWMIERSSSMTLLKILIPLSFLWLLVLYGLFLPIENLDRAVAVITTSFLSGIALYFSTERPQPLRMTVIDFVFAFFYSTVGIASIAVFSLNFFPDIYNDFMRFIKYLLPFSILMGYIYINKRIRSKKFLPRMTSL